MHVVTLEISDDFYRKFFHVLDALPAGKVQLKEQTSQSDDPFDQRIESYLHDRSNAVEFESGLNTIRERLVAAE